MSATHTAVAALREIDHAMEVSHLYALEVGTQGRRGDFIDVTADPVNLITGAGLDNKIEVHISDGTRRRQGLGVLQRDIDATDIDRTAPIVVHGATLAKNANSENEDYISAAVSGESAARGGIDEATAFNFVKLKTLEEIAPLKYGLIEVI